MINTLHLLMQEFEAGRPAVVAVVTSTWGSAPRQAGSMMLVRADGSFEGSVSGGCVEGNVIAEAAHLIGASSSKRLEFSVANDDAFAVGLACGGAISVSLFALTDANIDAVRDAISAISCRTSGCLAFNYKHGIAHFSKTATPDLVDTEEALKLPVSPRPRLDIIGAVHIAQALAPMAVQCGYDVTVIDPRQAFTEARSFGDVAIVNDWPDDYFTRTPPDSATAVVTLTHDPKLDDAALLPALGSDAFYLGCLGSRKTHAARLKRLRTKGITGHTLKRIHGPVGLNIGAQTPAEIAVSILSQIIQIRQTQAGRYAV